MSKRISTKDVFDRLAENNDPAEPEAGETRPEPDATDSDSDHETDGDWEDNGRVEHTDDDDQALTGQPTGRRGGRRLPVVLLSVALVAALGMSGYLGWRVYQLTSTATAGQAALETARNYALTLTTLDAKEIDKHYNDALDGATGIFKDEYSQGSAELRQLLIDNKAAGKGTIIDAAVKSATKDRVEVLLFVDQSITNATLQSPRIDRNRVQMTMELVDGRWLASKVDIT